MNNFVKFPLVLGIVGIICTGALSVVYEATKDTIAYNKNKVAIESLKKIVDDVKDAQPILEGYEAEPVEKAGLKNMYRVVNSSEEVTAYGYLAEVNGYNPGINFMLVIDAKEPLILGFEVVSHSETNSGSYGGPLLNSPEFAAQFKGLTFDQVASEVDFVAGSTAKVTLSAVLNGVDKVISFHKEQILGEEGSTVELSSAELAALKLPEGYVLEDQTELFKEALKAKVTANMYNKIINVEVKDKTQYTKIYNYVAMKDAAGEVKGYAYVAEGQYNCEVEHGNRAWQKHKFVVMFNVDGTNAQVIVVNSSDSLGAIEKGEVLNDWINASFNGQSMAQLNTAFTNQEVEKVVGASYTTSYFLSDLSTVVNAHSRAYGN